MAYTPVVNADTLELYIGSCATGNAVASSTTLSEVEFFQLPGQSAATTFTPADVGMPIAIVGGGPVNGYMPAPYFVQGSLFHTTIATYVSPTEVTLTAAPDTSIFNTGFYTIIVYRRCLFASDVASNAPTAFQFNSSIAPGTRDTMQFTVFNSLGEGIGGEPAISNPYIDRFSVIVRGQPVYLRSTDSDVGDIFGGFIDTLTVSSQPGIPDVPFCWSATCASWAGLATRRVVPPPIPQQFAAVDGDVAFSKIVLFYLENDGVDVSVTSAPAINLDCPVGAVVSQLLDQVVSLISTSDAPWYWYADPWRVFVLAQRTATSAPWDITDGSDLFTGASDYQQSIVTSGNQLANVVYVIGQNTLLNTIPTQFTGDGSSKTFNLPVACATTPTITLNSGSQTVGVLGVDSGDDWYWAQGSTVITQDSGGTTLTTSDILLVTFTSESPQVAQAPNEASLTALQGIEGTSANYQTSFTVTQPITPNDLLNLAIAYELEYGEPATTCQLYTLRPGLKTGQLQSIALESAGIPSGNYLIATVQMTTVDNVIVWQYTAFGGANIGNSITALTQFINRGLTSGSIVTPLVPITAPGGPPQQFCIAYSASGGVNMATMPETVNIGDVIILVAGGSGGEFTGPSFAVSDNYGNSWSQIVYQLQNQFFFPNASAIWWTTVTTGGPSMEITVTSAFAWIAIVAPLGVTGVDVSGGSNTSSNPTLTTTQDTDFIVTGGFYAHTTPTVTSPEAIVTYGLATTNTAGIAMSYATQDAAGSFTSSLAMDATNGPGGSALVSVAFKTQIGPPPQTVTVIGNPMGTVTHTTGALTDNLPVLGNGGADAKIGVAGQLVPAGGTTGQVLAKTSGADYATGWESAGTGTVTNSNTLTAGYYIIGDGGTEVTAVPPTHSEPLTDGNSNFIFADGDIVVVLGVPN